LPELSNDEIEAEAELRQASMVRLQAAAEDRVATLWDQFMVDLSDGSFEKFVEPATDALSAITEVSADYQISFLETCAGDEPGSSGVTSADVLPTIRNGMGPIKFLERALARSRAVRAGGASLQESLQSGRNRAALQARTETLLATTLANTSFAAKHKGFEYYRRKPNAGACVFCLVACTKLYKMSALMPIHTRCSCFPVPVPNGLSKDGTFSKIYDEDTWNKIKAAKRAGIELTIDEHGELGPVLRTKRSLVGVGGTVPVGTGGKADVKLSEADKIRLGVQSKENARRDPTQVRNQLKSWVKSPGFTDLAPVLEGMSDDDMFDVLTPVIEKRMSDYMVWIHDQIPIRRREMSRLWYTRAHEAGAVWGPDAGFHPDIAYALLARLSPSQNWPDNMSIARHFFDQYKKNQVITQDHVDLWDVIRSRSQSDLPVFPPSVIGKRLRDLDDDTLAGTAVRMLATFDGVKDSKAGFLKAKQYDEYGRNTGTMSQWQTTDNLTKAWNILRVPTRDNVNRQLGSGGKIRTFYQNIREPRRSHGITADTHALAVAINIPISQSTGVPGTKGSKKSRMMFVDFTQTNAAAGNRQVGLYWLVQAAYEDAAKRRGYHYAQEFQSIVWDWQFPAWPKTIKKTEVLDSVMNIHYAADRGEITLRDAFDMTEELRLFIEAKGTKWVSKPDLLPEHLRKYHPMNAPIPEG